MLFLLLCLQKVISVSLLILKPEQASDSPVAYIERNTSPAPRTLTRWAGEADSLHSLKSRSPAHAADPAFRSHH